MDSKIFKAYDVRGIYPEELDVDTAFKIGQAVVKYTGAKNVVIGHDARLSGPILFENLAKGMVSAGAKVCDIGMVLSECLYFATANYDFDAGVMVTASHNPKEYNGFKVVIKNGNNLKVISGESLFSAVTNDNLLQEQKIEITKKDIWPDYLKHVLLFADFDKIKPFKIVVDASNGVAGLAVSKIKEKLPVEIFELNFQPDGNFFNHSPNPLADGSIEQISREIKNQKADFGFIFDGDADRIFLVDENGKIVSSDVTILILAKYFLQKNPGMTIARHATCSKAIPEFVEKWGGKSLRTKVGFIHIQQGLIENNGIMGGELTGHYCFRDNFYSDSGIIAFLTLLQVVSQNGRKVSEIAKELSPYYKPPEINFKVINKNEILEKIKQKYADGAQDFLDGITVQYVDWWFNVRASNTEPLLRLTIEANTPEIWEQKKFELSKLITE